LGPLDGVRVLDVGYGGPATFTSMILADFGADVVNIERPDADPMLDMARVLTRGQRSVLLDLKHEAGAATVLRLVERADILVEGFRPGVTERLGIGPDECLARNPRLVYGRLTGWGQHGPYAHAAGHDINYIAMAGALGAMGPTDGPPTPPPAFVGDFGGGGMLLVAGVLAALHHARATGQGQVVDAAMVDGAALLSTVLHGLRHLGLWGVRGTNLIDGGAPFYATYEAADGEWICVGALEPKFYTELLRLTGVTHETRQMDRDGWPELRRKFEDAFRTKTRAEWERILGATDACFSPVPPLWDAHEHPHNTERGTFVVVDGVRQPAPAPRFTATPAAIRHGPPKLGEHTDEALREWGFVQDEIAALRASGALG
jgi:alpha-methylacyl-CoA racemase